MKLETFFEKFDQFADAPDAVAKMRELVLELAVQGKLVAQDPTTNRQQSCSSGSRQNRRADAVAQNRADRAIRSTAERIRTFQLAGHG